ncbi:hypothetical protein DH2020_010962 [Rehmannia glutinosa]|uniref:Disease resistance R13L4/SHOC-2-like LRR domain-containing protein n=1 Tax=Rehmannia glutinosa TaxID=99300 RepID=A0ABR0XC54_REHGL
MATVVSLMQDLDQLLSSYGRIFSSEQRFYYPFTKKEIEILYDTVSLMDSLLRDSSGEHYNRELMNQILEKRIRDVAYKAGNYVDFWAVRSLSGLAPYRIEDDIMMIDDESFLDSLDTFTEGRGTLFEPKLDKITIAESTNLTEITQEIGCINEELKKIHDDRKVHGLEDAASTGKLHSPCRGLPEKNLHHGLIQVPHDYHHDLRRLSFHSSIHKYINKASFPYARSVMCFEKLSFSDPRSHLSMAFKLLKVLDIMNIRLGMLPNEIKELTQLKFLALTIEYSSKVMFLFTFLSLQTLIVDCEWDGRLPTTFWNMLELRHFHLKRSCLSFSPTYSTSVGFLSPSTPILDQFYAGRHPLRVQNNLQSLSTIRPSNCSKRVFLSMPHLKKLGVYETEEDYRFRGWFRELIHLQKLEKLKYVFSNPFVSPTMKPDRFPSWDSFPPKLMKLTLSGTSLPWEDMSKLGMLPKLEVLKLRNYAFAGEVCKSREGGFPCLKFLLIGSTNLETWEADGNPFPNLQHLVLRHCRSLKEIPYGIGEAPFWRRSNYIVARILL